MTLTMLLGIIGPWQVVLIVLVLLLLFGGRKIPELMKGIGQGMTEFKKARKKDSLEDKEKQEEKEEEEKKEINK